MSDMGEDFRALREFKKEGKTVVQDGRIKYAKIKLLKLGWSVGQMNQQPTALEVKAPNGQRYHFWPYTGWFNRIGPGNGLRQGRGIANLIKEAGQ